MGVGLTSGSPTDLFFWPYNATGPADYAAPNLQKRPCGLHYTVSVGPLEISGDYANHVHGARLFLSFRNCGHSKAHSATPFVKLPFTFLGGVTDSVSKPAQLFL